ncbi:MED4 [Candida pseudojiufengensis]|uniref:MED4 n=1 Tax=Candida pseudojiufengensis TaxID=497109 RepID=UPI002225A980|nr:MED4 [Candida pseudojiufengensis]KAI5965225.1 MED4 [Candida pseudojiufengensis]
MLPHKRANSPFTSNPVSRVASSARLNQLNQDSRGNLNSSIPSTPSYITSSLNPTKNIPTTNENISSKIRTEEDLKAFNNLPIVTILDEFKQLLAGMSDDIINYRDVDFYTNLERIIKVNTNLQSEVYELSRHKERGEKLSKLTKTNEVLDDKLKSNLKKLLEFRSQLKKLPKLPQTESSLANDKTTISNASDIDVNKILDYAMKLAKFTKAPAAVGNMANHIHPNNYIWPAEDSLRRGMLAMSSLQGNEIIEFELNDGEKKEDEEDIKMSEEKPMEEKTPKNRNSNSYNNEIKPKAEDPQLDLNLDLFDPDDEYSD